MNTRTTIRVAALEGFRDLVFELGGDPSRLLQRADIEESIWQTPEAFITTTQYRKVLNFAAQETRTARFGLILSQRQSLNKIGAVGYLIGHAPDLRTALNLLPKHLRTHDTGTLFNLLIQDKYAIFTHTLDGVSGESAIQQTDIACGLVVKFFRQAINPKWSPEAMYFEHSRPDDISLYQRIFRCPVYFDHDQSGLEFRSEILEFPLRASDPQLYAILKNYVQQISERRTRDLVSQVRTEIINSLESGKTSLNDIAGKLSISRSELQRQLKRHDTNYRNLLDGVRFSLARKYLIDTELPLSTITFMLGYSEPAVFSRSFKRHTGCSPRAWRKQNRQ